MRAAALPEAAARRAAGSGRLGQSLRPVLGMALLVAIVPLLAALAWLASRYWIAKYRGPGANLRGAWLYWAGLQRGSFCWSTSISSGVTKSGSLTQP